MLIFKLYEYSDDFYQYRDCKCYVNHLGYEIEISHAIDKVNRTCLHRLFKVLLLK